MAQDGEGSQDAQLRLKTLGIQRKLGSLRSFTVLRLLAFGYEAPAVQDDSVYATTPSVISAPFGTTTIPLSVTVKRWRSASRSYPIVVPGGIFTPLSMIVRRI